MERTQRDGPASLGRGIGREPGFDNLRFVLIFCVVFAHLAGMFPGRWASALYTVIYSFHMPAFLFLTGRFARFRPGKLLRHLVLPYFVFQTLYLLFDWFVLQDRQGTFRLYYTTPYGLMWYLMTASVFFLLLPMIGTERRSTALAVLGGAAVLALLIGFDASVSSYLSLSRIVVFFPFFAAGFYSAKVLDPAPVLQRMRKHKWLVGAVLAAAILGCEYLLLRMNVHRLTLFGMCGYQVSDSSVAERLLLGVCACLWITALLLWVPNRRIPWLTAIGENTMAIYLLHGFVQKLLDKYEVFRFSQKINLVLALAITCVILAAFGNRYVGKLFRKIF